MAKRGPHKPKKVMKKRVFHECPSCGGRYDDGSGVKVEIDNRVRKVQGYATFCTEECAYRTILEGRVTALQPPVLISRRTGRPVDPRRASAILGGQELRLPAAGAHDKSPIPEDVALEEDDDPELEALRRERLQRLQEGG